MENAWSPGREGRWAAEIDLFRGCRGVDIFLLPWCSFSSFLSNFSFLEFAKLVAVLSKSVRCGCGGSVAVSPRR